jgi:HAD superfamily hydrolase (TIGR01450 family)
MDLRSLRAFVFDLDGCVYHGETLLPGVDTVLDTLRRSGRRVLFLTNNSREGARQLLGKFRRLGIAAELDEIVSAAETAGQLVRELYGPSRVLAVGSQWLLGLLKAAGHTLVPLENYEHAQVVVMGHDEDFSYRKCVPLARAARAGAAFFAVNLDPRLDVEDGEFYPGCGAMVEAVAKAAGVRPILVGKPEPHLFRVALERLGLPPRDVVMVGDSIHADVRGAQRVGLHTIWIAPPGAEAGDAHPDLTIRAYAELLPRL